MRPRLSGAERRNRLVGACPGSEMRGTELNKTEQEW